jgi:hypothetical protein
MLMIVLGSTGLGLVWGWLIGSLEGRVYHVIRTVLSVAVATLLLATGVLLLSNWYALFFFLGASVFSMLLHIGWRRELYNRFGPSR